jgi:hypothetical protein
MHVLAKVGGMFNKRRGFLAEKYKPTPHSPGHSSKSAAAHAGKFGPLGITE